jgi:hypothetical protein
VPPVPDWTAAVFRPLYAEFGVPAVLTLDAGTFDDLVAIDLTAGVTAGGAVDVETELPMATFIARDLAERGILLSQLDGGTIALNSRSWEIKAHQVQSTTGGDGEVLLILEATG